MSRPLTSKLTYTFWTEVMDKFSRYQPFRELDPCIKVARSPEGLSEATMPLKAFETERVAAALGRPIRRKFGWRT